MFYCLQCDARIQCHSSLVFADFKLTDAHDGKNSEVLSRIMICMNVTLFEVILDVIQSDVDLDFVDMCIK